MLNGYSGHSPSDQTDFEQALRGFPDATAVAMLRAKGATHVTINCALYRGGCDELLSTVDASPRLPAGVGREVARRVRSSLRARA